MQDLLSSLDDHDEVFADAVEIDRDTLSLTLRIVGPQGQTARWELQASGHREHRIGLGWCSSIAIANDHPLLWSYLERHASLYFSDAPHDVAETIGTLWQVHQQETQGSIPFARFMNRLVRLDNLLSSGAGLLASGPERLLRAYGQVLEARKIRWSIAGSHAPKYWSPAGESHRTGAAWTVENAQLQVLTLGGSYIIAVEFAASRRP